MNIQYGQIARTIVAAVLLGQAFVPSFSLGVEQTFPTMTAALDEITARYHIQAGLEYALDDSDQAPITLDFRAPNVESVLDSLAAQKTEYSWSLRDGVYDIFPKVNGDSILGLRIEVFSITGATGREASDAIGSLPEVREWMLKHGVKRRELVTGPRWAETDPRISLTIRNVPLRDVLNHILMERGTQEWVVSRYGEKKQFLGIYV